jgi:hypothetical protein
MYPSKPYIYYFLTNCITVLPLYGRAVLYILTVIAHCALFWESFCMAVYWFGTLSNVYFIVLLYFVDRPAISYLQTYGILYPDLLYFVYRPALFCVQTCCILCTACCILCADCCILRTGLCFILRRRLLCFVSRLAVFCVKANCI